MREQSTPNGDSAEASDPAPTADQTPGFRSRDDESDHVHRSLPRRRLLAAVAVPGLLAGCLVESEEGPDGSAGETDPESSSDADRESDDGTGDDATTSQQTGDQAEDLPDALGPDGSGLVVTDAAVLDVTDDGYERSVRARLTVENAGRFTYGTVEFRVDAYATPPNSGERDAVGYAYVHREFPSEERFGGGTRAFDVTITFRSRKSRSRADPNWYDIDAAVRRAEPS